MAHSQWVGRVPIDGWQLGVTRLDGGFGGPLVVALPADAATSAAVRGRGQAEDEDGQEEGD